MLSSLLPLSREMLAWGSFVGVSMTSAVVSPESPVILARAEEVAENPPWWGQLRLL